MKGTNIIHLLSYDEQLKMIKGYAKSIRFKKESDFDTLMKYHSLAGKYLTSRKLNINDVATEMQKYITDHKSLLQIMLKYDEILPNCLMHCCMWRVKFGDLLSVDEMIKAYVVINKLK